MEKIHVLTFELVDDFPIGLKNVEVFKTKEDLDSYVKKFIKNNSFIDSENLDWKDQKNLIGVIDRRTIKIPLNKERPDMEYLDLTYFVKELS